MVLVLGLSGNCLAELYMEFVPYESINDIKARYPNATFTKISPAWAKESDAMYSMEGAGIPGKIVFRLFYDVRFFQEFCATRENEIKSKFCESKLSNPENMMLLEMVRFIPDKKISTKSIISKYGKPKYSTDENFNVFAEWDKRKISALLSEDKKFVNHIDYSFTEAEINRAVNKVSQ